MELKRQKTEYAYNLAAVSYEAKFSEYEPYSKQIVAFAKMFATGSSILDMGCGPGINAKVFSENSLVVTGVDISSEMIKLASKNCPAGLFHVSPINEFSSKDKFDGLCMSFIIVHLENEQVVELINKIPSLLKNGGKVYISFMPGNSSGFEKTSFSENEIFFNYFQKEFVVSCFSEIGMYLISSNSEPYENHDGSIADELFLVFK